MKIGLVFGGMSVEHEISIASAKNIFTGLKKLNFSVVAFYVDRQGRWFIVESLDNLDALDQKDSFNVNFFDLAPFSTIDLFFPIIHGTFGEDGSLQGFFELLQKPYVGPTVLGSALGMDKLMAKKVVESAGINAGVYTSYRKKEAVNLAEVEEKIGYPCFIKPISLGSSVGISKAKNQQELKEAIALAFLYDEAIIIEKGIDGMEIEVAVIGSNQPQASFPIRLIVNHDFYSYQAKYEDEKGCEIQAPFEAPKEILEKFQQQAIQVYKELKLVSMARVDFFFTSNQEIIFNEVNTIPGFTHISGFPIAWKASGLDFEDLLEILILEAHLRFQEKRKILRAKSFS
jgi:D-alanine-D-alanine ligase